MAAVEGQATQLDFHQAMEDFKTMFPDVDADVIEVRTLKDLILGLSRYLYIQSVDERLLLH